MMTDQQVSTATALLPVRVTATAGTYTQTTTELAAAEARGGLLLHTDGQGAPRWFATQSELDTPHATFRVDAR
jgi:hypothetical protein